MIYSENLADITFYGKSEEVRPSTTNICRPRKIYPSQRKGTPMVRSRQIRNIFLINNPQQNTEHYPKSGNENIKIKQRSCEIKKRRLNFINSSEQVRHRNILQKQKEKFLSIMKKYSIRASHEQKKIEDILNQYSGCNSSRY